MITTPDVDIADDLPCTISSFRLKHYQRAMVLRFAAGETAWELMLPDEDVPFTAVRVAMRELGSQRGAEASVLLPWAGYLTTRDWSRCVPDGWLSAGDIQPGLAVVGAAFAPMPLLSAFCFDRQAYGMHRIRSSILSGPSFAEVDVLSCRFGVLAPDAWSEVVHVGVPRCDLCGEPIPSSGPYGSGANADGKYCSLTCFALRDDRYIPSLTDLYDGDDKADDR